MLNKAALFAFGKLEFLAEDPVGGIPWWVILLLLVIVTIVVIWALTRNAGFTESDLPHEEKAHVEDKAINIPEEPAYVEPAPTPMTPSLADDLKVIEGIGPKIAEVLKLAGIQTFAQLAEADPRAISKILEDADPRLARLGDPTTWPVQAKLAAAGDQAGLKALQESLKGGRSAN